MTSDILPAEGIVAAFKIRGAFGIRWQLGNSGYINHSFCGRRYFRPTCRNVGWMSALRRETGNDLLDLSLSAHDPLSDMYLLRLLREENVRFTPRPSAA